jgi:hypothetical protein
MNTRPIPGGGRDEHPPPWPFDTMWAWYCDRYAVWVIVTLITLIGSSVFGYGVWEEYQDPCADWAWTPKEVTTVTGERVTAERLVCLKWKPGRGAKP